MDTDVEIEDAAGEVAPYVPEESVALEEEDLDIGGDSAPPLLPTEEAMVFTLPAAHVVPQCLLGQFPGLASVCAPVAERRPVAVCGRAAYCLAEP